MKKYSDLIDQTFNFPTKEFTIEQSKLHFNGVNLMNIIAKYKTPLKLTFLPKVGENIRYITKIFNEAIKKNNYKGKYQYAYCTKSSYFKFILEEVLKNDSHIETSSAFDIPIIWKLYKEKHISKEHFIICNGFKRVEYLHQITQLILGGFNRCIPVLDNLNELDYYQTHIKSPFSIGVRMASDEEPNFAFYTSRLGIRYNDILDFYKQRIKKSNAKLELLHFFINSGIKDSGYYWSELSRFMYKYCELKKICPELNTIDIGGGFPVKNSLAFEYDYRYMVEQIIENIQWICKKNHVEEPNIFTEFGSYTVGESGATIYSVLDQKLQNDKELWYMMDGSFITHMPDVWGLNKKFILLPINCWNSNFHKVNIGGLTCDSMDYYDAEAHISEVFLPQIEKDKRLYFGFFNTGAYQDALGGYGGIQHCLMPAPKQVIIDKKEDGTIVDYLFSQEQQSEGMLKTLGY